MSGLPDAAEMSGREALTRLFDSARVNGVAYLFALIVLGRASIPELVDLCGDERHTVGRYLHRLESRGFAVRVQDGRGELWHPTPLALQLFGARLLVEKLPALPSSSDLIRSDQSDQSDQIGSEEEEGSRQKKCQLARHYGFTGQLADRLVADPDIAPEDVIAWMVQVGQMKRDGFHFRRSEEAYALTCLLRHDQAPEQAYRDVRRLLEIEFPTYDEVEEDAVDEEQDDGQDD